MKTLPVYLSARTQRELKLIRAHISEHSPINAERFLDHVRHEINRLADIGNGLPLAPESHLFKFELKQIVVWPYRILFRVRKGRIEVLHVRHGNRLPASPDWRGNPN